MPLLSDQSTRKLPLWFLVSTLSVVAARVYLECAPTRPAGTKVEAVAWAKSTGLPTNVDNNKPLFLFLDNNNATTARNAERLFSDRDIAALLNSRYSARHIDTTDVVALGLMGPDLIKLRRRSALIVYGLDGKPTALVETFIPRRSLLQLLRQSLVSSRP